MPGAETRTSAHLCTMPLSVTVTATKLLLSASGLQIRFNGQDIVEAKPVPRNIPNTIPQSQEWYVSLKLTGAAKEVYENGIYELRLLDIDPSSQPTWTNNQAGAEQAAADIAVMIRSASGGGGGEVLIRNAADDETLATVTAPDSYVIPPIRIPYVDAAGALQYFVVYVDSIASGELTVTEPGGGAPPVPRFTVRTTDTATVVGYRDLVSPTMDLPQSKIRYKDEANATQELAASDTEFDGTNLRPATIIGRGTMRNSAGTGFDFVTAADLVANAVPDAPDVTYQRVDSASNPIGSPVDVPAGTAPNITCPDGTVANKASSPTYTLAVKSNSTELLPKVRVQLRDGSTVDYDYLPTPTVIHTEQAVTNVVRTYTAGDTWNKPAGLKELLVLAIGAGGGGGSGRRGAASSQRSAGGGGGGGAMVWRRIPAASLASTETVTIGAGGTGGAAQTADSTNGNAGTLGGDTSFGSLVIADGGGSGAAGSTGGSGTGGANGGLASACTPAFGPNAWSGQQRVTPSASNGDAGANGMNGTGAAPSGGAGGGISSANAVGSGGAGGGCYNDGSLTAGPTGGASSGGDGTAGTNNVGLQLLLNTVALAVGIGTAGSGGGASIVGAAGSGGAGGNYGAGGGGGGASLNGSNSGAGGNGAGGLVVLVEIYN